MPSQIPSSSRIARPVRLSLFNNIARVQTNDVSVITTAIYLIFCCSLLITFPFLAFQWREYPFLGAFVEQTLIFNSVGPQGDTSWEGIDRGLVLPYQLDAIDNVGVENSEEIIAALSNKNIGDSVTLHYLNEDAVKNTATIILRVFPRDDFIAYFIFPYIIGLAYFIIGVYVFLSRRDRGSGRAFAISCGSIALLTGGLFDLYTTHQFSWAWTFALSFAGASLFNFALLFPERAPIAHRIPALNWILYIPALFVSLWGEFVLYDFSRPLAYLAPWRAGFVIAALGILGTIVIMAIRTWRPTKPIVREQARLILWGVILSFTPLIYFLTTRSAYQSALYTAIFNVSLYYPPLIIFPLAIAYALLRYRTLSTGFIVARMMTYSLLAAFVGLMLFLPTFAAEELGLGNVFSDNPFFIGAFIFVLVALFQPMHKVIVSRIDGLFYLGSTAHNAYLDKYTREIAAAVDLDQVFRITKSYIQTVLNPSSYYLFIRRETEQKFYCWDSPKLFEGIVFQQQSKTVALMEKSHRAVYLPTEGKYDAELELDRPILAKLDANILVPINVEHELLGWFVLGPRQSGKPYYHRELVFVEELRDRAIVAIERATLYNALADSEAKFRTLLDTAAAAIFIFQGDEIKYANPTSCAITGFSENELVGMKFWETVHPEYQELVRERGLTRQSSQELPTRYDVKILRKDGQERWLDVFLDQIEYEGAPALIGAGIDITEKKRIEGDLIKSEERFRQLSHELATAQESERRRVAEQLHDETGQSLTALKIQLQMLQADISKDFPELSERVQTTVNLAELTSGHIRMLARGLRPTALDTLGLNSALENYCHEFADYTELKIIYQGDDPPPMSAAESLCFYRIAQEALTNIARHAEATLVKVNLVSTELTCTLMVQDNGRGFSISDQTLDGQHSKHIGMESMRDRIEILGGSLEFESALGKGTLVRARINFKEKTHD